jgi:prepilin-type N-terminal cleavage/methylation domain-containing protein
VVIGRRSGLGAAVSARHLTPIGRRQDGFTLLETVFALTILLIVAAGVMPLGLIAVKATENQGHLAARTTEYAQAQLEQLMALAFKDSATDTRVFPAKETNGSGLTVGGSSNPAAPVALYVDYLDINGNLLKDVNDASTTWMYKRAWSVTSPAGNANLKQITVTAIVRTASQGGIGELPRATVSAWKTLVDPDGAV